MSKDRKLVIVESPSKAKTINKMLGREYIVKSSVGHIRDLPASRLGVDVENSFAPDYVLMKGKKKIVDEIKAAAKECNEIYLAPDPDREGEAIAWHLQELLKPQNKDKKFLRVQYNEITPGAIRKAFANPGEIDMHRVDAQQARRILDRLVGYTVSPMLWRRIRRGLSAGRVQSVALRLVCDREKEIRAFVPEPYWIMGAMVRKIVAPLDPFKIKLVKINGEKAEIKSNEQATAIRSELENRTLRVADISTRDVSRKAPPPYITSSLQQAGSSHYGFAPNRTMSIAQKLYEGVNLGQGAEGLITYMRTDSFNVSRDALQSCRNFITSQFGAAFCPEQPNFYKSRGSAQEAHEAIRPTDVTRTPESLAKHLDPSELKLYRLIWQRFVASQMSPAVIEQRIARIEALPCEGDAMSFVFQASSSEIKFPGYMKVTGQVKSSATKGDDKNGDGEESDEVDKLPALSEGEPLVCLEWLSEEKETKPPSRFSEASLIREMEQKGVGRPSTYAQTISTIHNRKYVTRENRTLAPTDLGMQVCDLLVETLSELFAVEFTAEMESSLDEIEKGGVEWTRMLARFYEQFQGWMVRTRQEAVDPELVRRVLAAFATVKTWAPPVKRGKRTFSDEKFVRSIEEQVEKGEKGVTDRQYDALIRIACVYKDQIPDVAQMVKELGKEEFLVDPELQPPRETTLQKLELIKDLTLDESAAAFVESLSKRVQGQRSLTPAQIKALNNIVQAHSNQIADFEALKVSLDMESTVVPDVKETEMLIGALQHVKEWRPPVKRGKRVFNDQTFAESLTKHFTERGFLSERQSDALKKVIARYKDQVPDYEALAEQCGLKTTAKTSPRE